jgi:hypothetical protein
MAQLSLRLDTTDVEDLVCIEELYGVDYRPEDSNGEIFVFVGDQLDIDNLHADHKRGLIGR